MDFEIPALNGDVVYESSTVWDQHVMEIDYDISQALFLVLDTNFLLKHVSLLSSLATRLVENAHLMPPLFFVLPGVVVDELDYQSKYGVRGRARAATAWLQEQIELRVRTGRGVLRAQKEDETVRGRKSWRSLRGKGENDNIILDCCLYFAQLSGQVRLLSQDKNLALKATISDIPVIQISQKASEIDFIREVMPELRLVEAPPAPIDRSTAASRWAPPPSHAGLHLKVPQPSHSPASYDVDEDIDMGDISPAALSHKSSSGALGYRRLAEDPLENFIKNLQYNDVLTRAVGAIPYPETPRQTLSRISSSIPAPTLYFVSERGESGYRAGGIRMWSRGDITKAITALEGSFGQLGKLGDEKGEQGVKEDRERARKALVSIVRAFREEIEQRWRDGR